MLAGKLRLALEPRPTGRKGHPLEYCIKHPEGDINVEVKAPYRPISENVWDGEDSDLLQSALESANKQFQKDVPNLLVIIPHVRNPIFNFRRQITHAFLGKMVTKVPIDINSGGPAGPISNIFKSSGHFLKFLTFLICPFAGTFIIYYSHIFLILEAWRQQSMSDSKGGKDLWWIE